MVASTDNKPILLQCGSGYRNIVISQNGKIRPCEYLPEDIFCIDDIKSIESIINGDFHKDKLKECMFKYKKVLKEQGLGM